MSFISKGKFGQVFHYNDPISGLPRAIKMINNKEARNYENECMMAVITRDFQHTITCYKSFTVDDNVCLVMELAKSDLYSAFVDVDPSEAVAASLFHRVCTAVEELHNNNIAHLDLKLENILITASGSLKICDFGSAMLLDSLEAELPGHVIGSPVYGAPELTTRGIFQPLKADMWSLGVILHLLLLKSFPVNKVTKNLTPMTMNYSGLAKVSPNARDLLQKLICFNPDSRPSIKEVLEHPFLAVNNPSNSKIKRKSVKSKLMRVVLKKY